MNKEIKAKWIAALRSGQYKQGTSKLRDEDNNFCCLGVLCNLHAEAHPEIAAQENDPCSYMGNQSAPPIDVREWAGISSTHTIMDGGINTYTISNLARMNDSGFKFDEIANFIEKKL